jgi:glycosyltransferase involved in cell wall biosynthesis
MRIVHFCLANYYVDGFNYQENALSRQNKLDGHEVYIVASTRTIINSHYHTFLNPCRYSNEDGIPVIRVPYKGLPFKSHINAYKDIYRTLDELHPDVIFFHGVNSVELLTMIAYKKQHLAVKLYADNHVWYGQAGYRKMISKAVRIVLHKTLFKPIIQRSLTYIDKVFNISMDCEQYMKEMYDVPQEKMEFYPLGGNIIEPEERKKRGGKVRKELGISNESVVYLHSGRLAKYKRTLDILAAFRNNSDINSRLLIVGKIAEDLEETIMTRIKEDSRVMFLGWKNTEELLNYMCAADVYVQPGSQSASMQNAICCGCAVILAPYKSHIPFMNLNGYYCETVQDMIECFARINENKRALPEMSKASYKIAHELLDYKMLAKRIYR